MERYIDDWAFEEKDDPRTFTGEIVPDSRKGELKMEMKGVYENRTRLVQLMESLNLIGMARMHIGAGETEDFRIPFDKLYNDKKKIDEYGFRTKKYIYNRGFEEIEEAKQHFRQACVACPMKDRCGVGEIKKIYRENIFHSLLADKKLRGRFRSRVKTLIEREIFPPKYTCEVLLSEKRLSF